MLTAVALDPQPSNFSPGSVSPRSRFLPLAKGDSDRHKDTAGDLVRNELIVMASSSKKPSNDLHEYFSISFSFSFYTIPIAQRKKYPLDALYYNLQPTMKQLLLGEFITK
jgi:hypothetical protein